MKMKFLITFACLLIAGAAFYIFVVFPFIFHAGWSREMAAFAIIVSAIMGATVFTSILYWLASKL